MAGLSVGAIKSGVVEVIETTHPAISQQKLDRLKREILDPANDVHLLTLDLVTGRIQDSNLTPEKKAAGIRAVDTLKKALSESPDPSTSGSSAVRVQLVLICLGVFAVFFAF